MFVGLGQAEKRILLLLQERGVLGVADVLAAYPGVQPKSCRRAMRSLSSKGFGRLSETPVLTLATDVKKTAPVRKAERTSRRRKFSPGGRGGAASPSEMGPASFLPRHKTINGTVTAPRSPVPQFCLPVEEPIDAEFREISTPRFLPPPKSRDGFGPEGPIQRGEQEPVKPLVLRATSFITKPARHPPPPPLTIEEAIAALASAEPGAASAYSEPIALGGLLGFYSSR
jgi:hypothetical protein